MGSINKQITAPKTLEQLADEKAVTMYVPHPKRPIINPFFPKSLVLHKGQVYEVPLEIIDHKLLLPDNFYAVKQKVSENGGYLFPDGNTDCYYCSHYAYNLEKSPRDRAIKVDGDIISGCRYIRSQPVGWAIPDYVGNDSYVMYQQNPCVASDTVLAELSERGAFNGYKSKQKFKYPFLVEIRRNPDLTDEFKIVKGRIRRAVDEILYLRYVAEKAIWPDTPA